MKTDNHDLEKNKISSKLNEINNFISKNAWYDFELWSMKGNNLKIVGAIDLTWSYTLVIVFSDVYYCQIPRDWHTDTSKEVFTFASLNEQYPINSAYEIEQGYYMIRINTEYNEPIYISTKNIEVFYGTWQRDEL